MRVLVHVFGCKCGDTQVEERGLDFTPHALSTFQF